MYSARLALRPSFPEDSSRYWNLNEIYWESYWIELEAGINEIVDDLQLGDEMVKIGSAEYKVGDN